MTHTRHTEGKTAARKYPHKELYRLLLSCLIVGQIELFTCKVDGDA